MYPEIQQIKARLKLLDSSPHPLVTDGTYNIYTLKGESSLGFPYWYDVSFVSPKRIKVEDIADTNIYILLEDENISSEKKEIYGKIFKVLEEGMIDKKHLYSVKVVSPLYYLGETKRYEIYQDMTVVDIIQKIITAYGSLLDLVFESHIPPPPTREYTTQYYQSDLEFIQMLCQEEGITLNIQGDKTPFKIVLDNINDAYIPFDDPLECHFNLSKEFKVTHTQQDYYEFKAPSQEFKSTIGERPLTQTLKDNSKSAQLRSDLKYYRLRDRLEVSRSADLKRYIKQDSKRAYSPSETIYGRSQSLLTVEGYGGVLDEKKTLLDKEAIITRVVYDCFFPNAIEEHTEVVPEQKRWQFSCDFEAIPIATTFIPQYNITKPVVYSTVTALVSSGNYPPTPDFNTIDIDDKGRIRVIFHFDPQYPTSCYIRFANFWSGNGWGAQFIPRVNTEVIVSFLNGDPDRPVVIGSLYNGENRIPEDLPANKTKSYIKTQSMPGTPNEFNLLSFEDKGGSELIHMKAQKDHLLHVLHDSDNNIDHDERTVVGNDRTELVKHDEKITIGNNRTEKVGVNEDITIGANRTEKVGVNESVTIGSNQSLKVGANQTELVGMAKTETIGIAKALSIGAGYQVSVGASKNETVGLSSIEQVGKLKHIVVGKRYELQVGASSIILNSDGTIILSGKKIKIEGSKHIEINSKVVDIN